MIYKLFKINQFSTEDGKILLPMGFVCGLPTLSITPPDGHVGKEEVASIKVTFTSHLPAPITVDQITLQLHDQLSLAGGGADGQPIRLEKSPSQDSLGRLRALEAAAKAKGRARVMPDFKTEVKEFEDKPDSEKQGELHELHSLYMSIEALDICSVQAPGKTWPGCWEAKKTKQPHHYFQQEVSSWQEPPPPSFPTRGASLWLTSKKRRERENKKKFFSDNSQPFQHPLQCFLVSSNIPGHPWEIPGPRTPP